MDNKTNHPITVTCQVPNHNQKTLDLICTNPQCTGDRILCSKCAILFHPDCLRHIIDIHDIYKRTFVGSSNINLIKDKVIKDAASLLSKYDLIQQKGRLMQLFKEMINSEFNKLTTYFVEKVHDAKEKMIARAKELCSSESLPLEAFNTKLEELYNLDVFTSILQSLESNEKTREAVSQELSQFMKERNAKEEKDQNLQNLAKIVGFFTKNLLELEDKPFKIFKDQISFEIFDKYPVICSSWSWDQKNKSKAIDLTECDLRAEKTGSSDQYNTAILGSVEFEAGSHQWEIEVSTGQKNTNWISFGVIDKSLINNNLENFPYSAGIALSLSSGTNNMTFDNKLTDYNNKLYLCELNMDEGTFSISHEGKVIAKETKKFKGKTMIPFVDLCEKGNFARLVGMQPLNAKMFAKTPQ